jgi:hypothetical protein
MHEHLHHHGSGLSPVVRKAGGRAGRSRTQAILDLQRSVGNAAVGTALRKPGRLTVQRAGGLPTADEAKKEGGKAGHHVGLGKSTFSKILDALGKHQKLKDDDKAGRVTVLLQIQTLIENWRGSGKRAKAKGSKAAKDDRKNTFLGKLFAQTKVVYWEIMHKKGTLDAAATSSQQGESTNRQKIQAVLHKNNMQSANRDIDGLLARLRGAPLTTNFEAAEHVMRDGYFKNFWQITAAGFGGGKMPPANLAGTWDSLSGLGKREKAEQYLGYKAFTEKQRASRPGYCAVNVLNNPKGGAPTYGRFFFVWKDAVKARATYTARDTFAMLADPDVKDLPKSETLATNENMAALLAQNEKTLLALALIAEDRQAEADLLKKSIGKYIEAQVHGGLSMFDVEKLVVPYKQGTTDVLERADIAKAEALANKYKFPIQYG